jgi:hypothetical protein
MSSLLTTTFSIAALLCALGNFSEQPTTASALQRKRVDPTGSGVKYATSRLRKLFEQGTLVPQQLKSLFAVSPSKPFQWKLELRRSSYKGKFSIHGLFDQQGLDLRNSGVLTNSGLDELFVHHQRTTTRHGGTAGLTLRSAEGVEAAANGFQKWIDSLEGQEKIRWDRLEPHLHSVWGNRYTDSGPLTRSSLKELSEEKRSVATKKRNYAFWEHEIRKHQQFVLKNSEPFPGYWLFEDKLTAFEQISELREHVLYEAKKEAKKQQKVKAVEKGWRDQIMTQQMEKGCTVHFICMQKQKIGSGSVTRGAVVYPVGKNHLLQCFEELRKPDTGFTKRQKAFFQKMWVVFDNNPKSEFGKDFVISTVKGQLSHHNSNLSMETVLVEAERCLHRKQVEFGSPGAMLSSTGAAFECTLEKSLVEVVPRKRSTELRGSFDAPTESAALKSFRSQRRKSFSDYLRG